MFIRKKTYLEMKEKVDVLNYQKHQLESENERLKAPRKAHEPGPTCNGCKNLIKEKHLYSTFYHCKLDRGCKDYTEE